MRRRLLLPLVLTLAFSGCGTLFDTLGDKKPKRNEPRGISRQLTGGKVRIYGGVRWDFAVLAEGKAGFLLLLFALDVPVSAVLDTLLLPFTVPYNLLD